MGTKAMKSPEEIKDKVAQDKFECDFVFLTHEHRASIIDLCMKEAQKEVLLAIENQIDNGLPVIDQIEVLHEEIENQ